MALVTANNGDGITYTGATSSTIGPFSLRGGTYLWVSQAAGTSQNVSILGPDGSTFLPVNSQTTSAVVQVLSLPPGSYEIITVSASGIQGFLERVPLGFNY